MNRCRSNNKGSARFGFGFRTNVFPMVLSATHRMMSQFLQTSNYGLTTKTISFGDGPFERSEDQHFPHLLVWVVSTHLPFSRQSEAHDSRQRVTACLKMRGWCRQTFCLSALGCTKVLAEVKRATEGATERVLECLRQEMKGVRKSAMRVLKQEMELAMEPVIERVKKQEMGPAMERVKKQEMEPEMEPAMEPPIKRVRKRAMEPVKIQEMEPAMEPLIKRVRKRAMEPVKIQEMEPANEAKKKLAMEPTFSTQDAPADRNVNQRTPLAHQIKKSAEGELQLLFNNNKLPDKIYTNEQIKDDSGGFVEIKIIDTEGKTIEEGPLSSMEIKIHVLDGDFSSDGHENWTEQEFDDKILLPRRDKGLLVKGKENKGKENITLTDGVGTIQDLRFSDNSSWVKCKKFRLGARVVRRSTSYMGQVRIKEAITEAFAVRDHRAKMNKKHNLRSFDDEVWHLKKITRKGKFHIRLNDNRIHTIRDFKNMYKQNPNKLREILKDCKSPDWEEIIKDASFVVDDVSPVLHQAEETVPNLASRPLATSTGYPVNAQEVQSNSNFHPPTIGVSGWNSSQSNESSVLCSPHDNPAAQHASNAFNFNCVRHNAYSIPLHSQWEAEAYNNPTTGSMRHEYTVPNQASSQNNNGRHIQFSGVQHASYALEADHSNPLKIPAEAFNSTATGPLRHEYPVPNQGLAGMQNDCNPASSSQYMSAPLQEDVPNLTTQPPAMSIPSLNNDFSDPGWKPSQLNFLTSPSSYLMKEYSQINNGLHAQDTVMIPWDDLPPPS